MRLIDADNLQFGWCGSEMCGKPCDNCNKRTISKEDVDNAPTVEDRPQGKWNIISLLDDYVNLRCSECGQSTRLVRDSKNEFCCIKDVRNKIVACPYCGADMRGGRE